MKFVKRVQIVIRDDDAEKKPDQRIILEFCQSIKKAIEFLKEFGITVTHQALYHLWKLPDFTNSEISFVIHPEYHEKLMNLCPSQKKVPLDEALDKDSAHIGVIPMTE